MKTYDQMRQVLLEEALRESRGDKKAAAVSAGISLKTVYSWMKEFGLPSDYGGSGERAAIYLAFEPTPQQTAFLRALELLAWLYDQEISTAHVVLFSDGSGHLSVPGHYEEGNFTSEVRAHCSAFLRSERWAREDDGSLTLSSCGGFRA